MERQRFKRDAGRGFDRISINARADGRETDAADGASFGKREACSITARQMLRLAVAAVSIDRTHGVEDETRREPSGARDHRAACGTSALRHSNLVKLAHDRRAACAVHGAVYSAASTQAGVCGIHDGIHGDPSDVADH